LETLNDRKQDDSETTIYRRVATILDFMFRDMHIDLLIRYGKDTKDLKLSSNEFKKPSVTTSNAITQQCKNLRVNSAILNHLQGLNKKIDSLLAMDWIVAHHGVYVAKIIDILTIPTS
ncbi:uncharacterized protein BX664DRAFT_239544, partial [Halteromyces radiatus]|uniref:uncharacterized protein n=1 Tax=Halteromyces radiatus TaxID=101107 RepID=UPI0022209345